MKIQKNNSQHLKKLRQGSLTVEAAFLVPMAVLLTALMICFCFLEYDRVWYTAAACEAALVGTQRTENGENSESMARRRAQERIEAQPFSISDTKMQVSTEKRSSTVTFESSGETGIAVSFPYRVEETIRQCDPVGQVRTAWIAKSIMNGG